MTEENPLMILAGIFIGIPMWFFIFPIMLKITVWGFLHLMDFCVFAWHLGLRVSGG